MKLFKIIIGFLLLFGAGSEYVAASRQLGTLYSPSIIIGSVIVLIVSTWLIGSGFSVRKFKFKSFEFVKFFIISFVTFGVVALSSLAAKPPPSNIVEINGLKIPLGRCIDGSVRMIPNRKEREEYCKCLVEKILNDPELKLEYQRKLENNKVDLVIKRIQKSPKFLELGIENCFTSLRMEWTDNIASTLKKNMLKDLTGTEFEETNDIDKYCDCLVNEYKKLPLDQIMKVEFMESKEAVDIDLKCSNQSYK